MPVDAIIHATYVSLIGSGLYSRSEMMSMIDRLPHLLQSNGLKKLLVDMTGYETGPTDMDRYVTGVRSAELLRGIRISVYTKIFKEERTLFFEDVTQNRGLNTRLFYDREKALKWLLGPALEDNDQEQDDGETHKPEPLLG